MTLGRFLLLGDAACALAALALGISHPWLIPFAVLSGGMAYMMFNAGAWDG